MSVEFSLGTTVVGVDTTAPFSVSVDTLPFPRGPSTLRARALDAAGNAGTATVAVTVDQPPVASVGDPLVLEATSAAGASATVTGTGTDPDPATR